MGTVGPSHLPAFDDSLLASLFAREVFSLLLGEELISPEMVEKILLLPLSGFNVHSKVGARTKEEAEKVGKYMIRPLLSLERMDYLEFIARLTSHILDKR